MDDDRTTSFHFADDAAAVSAFLDAALAGLGEQSPLAVLDRRSGRQIEMPVPLAEALRELAYWMSQGRVASVTPASTWISIADAEDELGITRDTLRRLAAEGLVTVDAGGPEPRVNVLEGLRWKEQERRRTAPHMERLYDQFADTPSIDE